MEFKIFVTFVEGLADNIDAGNSNVTEEGDDGFVS